MSTKVRCESCGKLIGELSGTSRLLADMLADTSSDVFSDKGDTSALSALSRSLSMMRKAFLVRSAVYALGRQIATSGPRT
jgi:hypothetical protein